MELKTYFAQDRNGNLIPSATTSIYLTGTTTLASGLTTVSGAPLSNPFTADADGKIQFRAPDGIYDMQVSLGSTTGVKVTFQCVDVEQQLSDANGAADRAENAASAAEDAKAAAEAAAANVANDTYEVSTEAEMLDLTAKKGDVAIRSDVSKTFKLAAVPASTLANWKEMVGDALEQLQTEGDKKIKSSYGGTMFDDYAPKTGVFPLKNIYPTMTNAEINTILAAGGSVYVNAGTYTVSSNTDTWKLGQNSRIYWSPAAILQAGANSVTLLRGSSQDVGSAFIRNCKVFEPRLSLAGFNSCIGLHCYDMRNNSEITGLWMDMGLGTNNIGTLIEHYSFGIRFYDSEILNGGVGSTRIMLRNGVNAVTIKDHFGYSGDHTGPLPDYGIVIFNGMDGAFNFPDGSDLWPTAAVCITGGYSQNTSKYGLLESGVSTYVAGTYFERNAVSDVALGNGSYYFSSKATHHSMNIGESCFRSHGANHANIGAFNPADRSIGQFNFTGGTNCHADGSKLWGGFLDNIGVVDGLRLDLGEGSIKQYTSGTLPIKVREGYRSYRMNVSSGLNITVTGTPYDGQEINMLVRGSNIAALSFAGTPVDVTGANTATTKTASFTATYWASIGKWTLTMPQWTASS